MKADKGGKRYREPATFVGQRFGLEFEVFGVGLGVWGFMSKPYSLRFTVYGLGVWV
jgi:hypothetical protein